MTNDVYISSGLNQLAKDIANNPDKINQIIQGKQLNTYKVNLNQLKKLYEEYIRATG